MWAMQALEVRHASRVGELEGEVGGLHQSQAVMQATLATRLEESQLREQVCTTTPATPPVSGLVHNSLIKQQACRRWLHIAKCLPVTVTLETPCHALTLDQQILSCTATFHVMWTRLHESLFTGKLLTCAPGLQAKEAELKQTESAQAAALQEARSCLQEERERTIASHSAELQAVESRLQAEKGMRTAEGDSLRATIQVILCPCASCFDQITLYNSSQGLVLDV